MSATPGPGRASLPGSPWRHAATVATILALSLVLAACGGGTPAGHHLRAPNGSTVVATTGPWTAASRSSRSAAPALRSLPQPPRLVPLTRHRTPGAEGVWRAAGRRVHGLPAVFVTKLVLPGQRQADGIAWMDTRLLRARLYSGSLSPGGGPYRYTAPIGAAAAHRLVAAFNGGFKMKSAEGGYYTEGRTVDRLHRGAASLVMYAGGAVTVGAWGTDVRMSPRVVSVRQNLVPLVAGGQATPLARSADWRAWGDTCGAHSCAASVPGIEHQWRSAVGVTTNGALIYVEGPALAPRQLATLLIRAGVVRGMELDINPDWPVFAAYRPARPDGRATPANGHLLVPSVRGPDTFFDSWWARDFITMSAR